METIREIMDVERLGTVMSIPTWMQNIKVEVIVLPLVQKNTAVHKPKSMMGFLKNYANPALVKQEKDAWAIHLQEKYYYPI
ncbi:hypothetical protein AGMMS4956_01260 [Bacteroidia bacterium]|nr:hypothetical protein AGMMS4956_01260 [Bacteroidia bacterium]